MGKIKNLTSNIIKESTNGLATISATDILMTSRKIFLTDEVSSDSCDVLLKELMALNEENPHENITLYINSPGGDVYSGLAVYDYVRIMDAPLNTVCIGTAASMGALLFLAGKKRSVLPHSKIMIHDPSFGGGSMMGLKSHELKNALDDLNKTRQETAKVIAEVTGKTLKEIYKVTKDDKFFSAKEAYDFGLATDIIGGDDYE